MKAWMQRAVKPFVVVAKHIFRPDAGPISEERCLMLRRDCKCSPDMGELDKGLGPETGMEGLFQAWESGGGAVTLVDGFRSESEETGFRDGGPPIMPPSRKLIVGVVVEMRVAIVRAVLGETALRSM